MHYTRHLQEVHRDEDQLAKILAMPRKEKLLNIDKLRYEATFRYNSKIISANEGEIIVRRRSTSAQSAEHYLPCRHCLAFYAIDDLTRHARKCPHQSVAEKSQDAEVDTERMISAGQMLVDGATMKDYHLLDPEFRQSVLARMSRDNVTAVVKSDPLIMKFGVCLFRKLGKYRSKDIKQRMRQLGRFLIRVNTAKDSTLQLTDCIDGSTFDSVIDAVEELCKPEIIQHGINAFGVPSMGLKLGHSLLKCAHIKKGMSIRLRDHDMGEQADRFIALHKAEYTDTISSRCLATFRLRKMNKVEALPLTKDLVALNVFLNAGIKLLTAKLRLGFNYDTWRNLLEFVLCSLIVFNKRRGGEMSRMLLSAYTDRPDWKLWVNQEILDSLSALEKYLLDKLVMPIFHSSLTHYLLIFNNYICNIIHTVLSSVQLVCDLAGWFGYRVSDSGCDGSVVVLRTRVFLLCDAPSVGVCCCC